MLKFKRIITPSPFSFRHLSRSVTFLVPSPFSFLQFPKFMDSLTQDLLPEGTAYRDSGGTPGTFGDDAYGFVTGANNTINRASNDFMRFGVWAASGGERHLLDDVVPLSPVPPESRRGAAVGEGAMFMASLVGAPERLAAKAGEGGRFADLAARGVVGDGLTPHHMPQAALGFTSYADGGALMMPQAEHVLTRTYGYKGALTAQQESGMLFRDVLARDIRDVRGIAGSQYNQGLRDLLDYYRTNHPELMKK